MNFEEKRPPNNNESSEEERKGPASTLQEWRRIVIGRNVGTRLLISFGIALTMWFYVASTENLEGAHTFSSVPVDIRGLGEDVILGNEVGPVSIEVSASSLRLQTLTEHSLLAYLDLGGLGPGVHNVPVKVDVPFGVSGWSVEPDMVQVQLDSRARKTVPVEVKVMDSPPFGYELKAAQFKPAEVVVSGPENLVESVKVAVVQVSVEGKQATFNGTQKPTPTDSNGKEVTGVTLEPDSVSIVVPIELQFGYKAVPVKPAIKGQPAPGYFMSAIRVRPATVTIVGDPVALAKIDFLATQPVEAGQTTSDIQQEVDVVLPEGVSLYRSGPVTVNVTVTQIQTEMTVSIVPKVVGLSPELYSVIAPTTVNVTIVGLPGELQNLQLTDIQVTLDVNGLSEGTYGLSPKVEAPGTVTVSETTPGTVQVTLITAQTPTATPSPTASPPSGSSSSSIPAASPSTSRP